MSAVQDTQVQVIVDKCQMTGHNRCTVVVEGRTVESVMTKEAKELALRHAATMGVSRPGIGTSGGPYVVGANGETGDPRILAQTADHRYRHDYPIQGGL